MLLCFEKGVYPILCQDDDTVRDDFMDYSVDVVYI